MWSLHVSHRSTPPNTSLYHTLSKPVPPTSLSHYLTLSYPSFTTTASESFHIQPQPVFLYPPCHNFNIPPQTLLQVNSCKHIQCARWLVTGRFTKRGKIKLPKWQGRRKTFRGGAATGKKHAFGRNEAEKFISASRGYPLKTLLRIYLQGKYGGVDRAYSQERRPGGSKIALVHTCTRMRRIRLVGLGGGMLSQEIFFENLLLWDGFWAFFGPKTSPWSLPFSLGMVTEFASRPYTWRLVSIGIGGFMYTRGTGRRSGARKPVNILLLWILFRARKCGHRAHICLF